MKIAFVLPELYPHPGGGLATYYLHYISKIKPYCSEIKIFVGSATEQRLNPINWEGISISYLNPKTYKKYFSQFSHFSSWPEIQGHLAAAWGLYEQANAGEGFDIIETTDWGWNYLPFVLDGHKNLITRLHGSIAQIEYYDPRESLHIYAHLTSTLELETLALVHNLVTYSYNNQKFWQQELEKEVQHIYPIIDLNDNGRNIPPKEVPSQPYALVVGRIQAWKGAEILCQALQYNEIGIPIYWMGRDTSYKEFESSYSSYLAKKYPGIWGEKIIPIGARPTEECQIWMQNATFGIVPSTWDMFNLTIAEWINTNKPLVCSSGAGGYSLLENMPIDLLVESNSPDSLFEALHRAVNLTVNEKTKLITAQKDNFYLLCNKEKLVAENLALYRKVLDNDDSRMPMNIYKWRYRAYYPSKDYIKRTTQLDQWPLKELVKYLGQRMLKRLFPK